MGGLIGRGQGTGPTKRITFEMNRNSVMAILYRAKQKRDFHRTWRARSRPSEDLAGGDNACGEGPSGAHDDEEFHVESQESEEYEGLGAEVETGRGVTGGAESQEENVVLTQTQESFEADAGDTECERLTPRHRKCGYGASKLLNEAMRVLDSGYSDEEKKIVLHRFFSDERIRSIDPEFTMAVLKLRTASATTVQSLRGALQTLRSGCIQGKSKVRNIVLTAAVSKGDSQRRICNALGASRYLVRKAFRRREVVDETGENLWAGGDRKRRSDALSQEDQSAVCSWWETETTVSPNKRDVKRRRIGVKEHETHATHYLQVSQVR